MKNVPLELEEFKKTAQFPKNHKPDFKLFLSKFRNDWYDSLQDVYDVVFASVSAFKKENLFFLELRFSPEHFALKNNFDRVEVAKVVIDAANRAAKEIGLNIKYLITFNRNKQNQQEMLDLYKRIVKAGLSDVVGWDLAGDEILNPPEEFTQLFDTIYSDRAGITIHAGEVTTPKQVWAAIDLLHATRVGHGTVSLQDKKLIEALIKRKIILEQCPVSNFYTGSCIDTPNHPFKKLNQLGVLVTLNSDDPTIQDATLDDDFLVALKHFDIDYRGLVDLNIRAIEGSFVSNKAALVTQYKKKIEDFEKRIKS